MRIHDFERAIEALAIEIEEMVVMPGGNVKATYGHTQTQYVKWDEFGRGFSAEIPEDRKGHYDLDPRHEVDEWTRAEEFDLKFE